MGPGVGPLPSPNLGKRRRGGQGSSGNPLHPLLIDIRSEWNAVGSNGEACRKK